MKNAAEPDDKDQIYLDDFLGVCRKYGLRITKEEKNNLCLSYPGRDENDKSRINIYPIYDQKYNLMAKKVYSQVNVVEADKKEDAVDACGYTGQFHF